AIELTAERRTRAKSAADQHVVALDCVTISACLNLAGQQSDLADKMLGARMVTPGQVDIDRRVQRYARFAPASDVFRVAFGVGSRKLAPRIARTGDQSGPDRIRLDRKPERFDPGLCLLQFLRRHAGNEKVLPNREPDVAVAQFASDISEPANLPSRQIPDWNN